MKRIAQIHAALIVSLVAVLSSATPASYGQLPPGPLWPSGTVVRANDAPSVYVIQNGAKRWIPGPQCHSMAAWENVVLVFSYLLNQKTPDGPPMECSREGVSLDFRTVWAFQDVFQDGARHIGTSVWTMQDGRINGVIRYESDSLVGVCGGSFIGLLDADGYLLHYFTPPTGCVNGKLGGSANQRFVEWTDVIPASVQPKVKKVLIKTDFTGRPLGEIVSEVVRQIKDAVNTASDAAVALQNLKAVGRLLGVPVR